MQKNGKKKMLLGGTKRTPIIRTRLLPTDVSRFEQECFLEKKTATEVAREAICFYLDNKEQLRNDARESVIERRIKKMEDRIAALQARTAIDVGMVYMLIYRNMDLNKRDDLNAWAYHKSVERLRTKLEGSAAEVKELMRDDKVGSKA